MDTARIAELLKPFLSADPNPRHSEPAPAGEACPEQSRRESAVLSSAQMQSISTYIDILLRWNARINLTAIRDPEDIVTRHFGESFFAARHLFPNNVHVGTAAPGCPAEPGSAPGASPAAEQAPEGRKDLSSHRPSIADIGSGAGFPGLPIKLWAPHISLTLIESNHKKATFLREVTRALTLTDVNIQNTRAEILTETFAVVTLRAVEHFETILPTAATLVAPGGRLALLIGTAQQAQARSTLPHLTWSDPVPVPQSRARMLLVAHRPTHAMANSESK